MASSNPAIDTAPQPAKRAGARFERRSLVVQALVLTTVAELVLRTVRMRRMEYWALRATSASSGGGRPAHGSLSAAEVADAVRRGALRSPARPMCLAQALVAAHLLTRRGLDAELKIGVGKSAAGAFEAHAWIERGGLILLGAQPDIDRFRVIYSKAWGASQA